MPGAGPCNSDSAGSAQGAVITRCQFRFQVQNVGVQIPVGGVNVAVPLINIGAIGPGREDLGSANRLETLQIAHAVAAP